jgi:hypothetical protein
MFSCEYRIETIIISTANVKYLLAGTLPGYLDNSVVIIEEKSIKHSTDYNF